MAYTKEAIAELENLCDAVREWILENCEGTAEVTVSREYTRLNETAYESIGDIADVISCNAIPTATKNIKKAVAAEEMLPFNGELLEAVNDWFQYKRERRQSYKPRGKRIMVNQICKYADRYGEAAVANAIRDSIANNYQGIVFDRIRNQRSYEPTNFYDIGNEMMEQSGGFGSDVF